MKKRVISLLAAVVMLFSVTVTASAAEHSVTPYASEYLDGYMVALTAKGNGLMSIAMSVDGVGVQDQIGVMSIDIDQKVNGVWKYYDTMDAVDHPEFYDYNSRDYMGNATFYGTPGITYRVTLMAYAQSGSGSDTGYVTSYAILCK